MHFLRGAQHRDTFSTWTSMYGVLYDDLSPMTFSFFFSPLFSILPLKFALAIQTFIIVFSFIDISVLILIFLFIFFVLGPFVKFFFFNLIIGSIIIICYFFKFKPHSFDFFCFRLFYEFEFSFLFPSSIQNSKQSSHLLFLFQNRSSFSLLLFFFILLYN